MKKTKSILNERKVKAETHKESPEKGSKLPSVKVKKKQDKGVPSFNMTHSFTFTGSARK